MWNILLRPSFLIKNGLLEKDSGTKKTQSPEQNAERRPFSEAALTQKHTNSVQIIQARPSLDAFVIASAALPRKKKEVETKIWSLMMTEKEWTDN